MNQVLLLIKAFCQIFNTLDISKQSNQLNGVIQFNLLFEPKLNSCFAGLESRLLSIHDTNATESD